MLLVAVGFAVYWNSLPAPFTFDDDHAIVLNEQIRHISTSLSPTEQGSPLAGRPLVSLTFAMNYALGGLSVRGYRLVNIAIHVMNGLLLFGLVGRTLARQTDVTPAPRIVAFAIALIWMLHPLVTEPVDYVSQRTELMMTTFFLLTLRFAQRAAGGSERTRPPLQGDSTAWLWASVAACALGMACKETMVVAPIVVLLYRPARSRSGRFVTRCSDAAGITARFARRGSCSSCSSGHRRVAIPPASRARRCLPGSTC